jgi:legumain
VFHAYQVLISGGYRRDHIVVMAYDDIANNPENPMPGKVFNRPGVFWWQLLELFHGSTSVLVV